MAEEPYVVFVEGNLKGGVSCTLGRKTLIIGPTGSGKSAVPNALELALSGRVSDVRGRQEVAREIDLMELAPGRKGELLARAVLSDGSEAVWRAGGKSKKARHTYPEVIVDPATVFPLRPVHEAIVGSVETARKFFLQYAVGAITDADVLARIPASSHNYYKRAALATTLSSATAVDRLLAALEHAKKEGRAAEARAKAADGVSAETAQGLPTLPTESEEKALRDQMRDAEKALADLRGAQAAVEALQGVAEKIQAAKQRHATATFHCSQAEQALVEARAVLAAMPVPPSLDLDVQAVVAAIRAHASGHLSQCLVCESPRDAGYFAERATKLEGWLKSVAAQAQGYEDAKTRVAMAAATREHAQEEIKNAESALGALLAASGALTTVPAAEVVASAEAEVARLREAMRRVDIVKASWESARKAKDSAESERTAATEWKKLAEACVGAIAQLLDTGVASFIARVQRALPHSTIFDLTLRDGARAVFQFGLKRDGVLHTALSGGEWSMVTAAIAAACRPPAGKLSVVIPEDRGLDRMTLRAALDAFSALDSQVIVASPIEPVSVPAGWHVVNTAANEQRAATAPARPGAPTHAIPVAAQQFEAPPIPLFVGEQ